MHLVAGLDEVVDRGDPLGDRAGADVEQPGVTLGHEREPDAGAALRVIAYFDSLVEARAGLQSIVRGAAVLADWTRAC